jgi:FAD/FMN-containing dehydrogenase
MPGVRVVAYGRVGDGNLHDNLSKPVGSDDDAFPARAAGLSRVVHDATAALGGSISAEHGLGRSRRDLVADHKDPLELELMRGLEQLLDPAGLMNPGKVLPEPR